MTMKNFPHSLSSALTAWRFAVVCGSLCCFVLMLAIGVQPFFAVGDFTRDPAAIALHPPYFGLVSNLGILLWSASAAVCFLSGMLLKVMQPEQRNLRSFFTVFGTLSAVLCLDDTFLLHEAILPNRLPLVSIPEPVVVMTYALALLGSVVYFRKLILQNQPLLLGLVLVLFSVSVGFDQLLSPELMSEDSVFWIEDGSKLLAIFLWLAYFVRASLYFVTRSQFALAAESLSEFAAVPLSDAPTDVSTDVLTDVSTGLSTDALDRCIRPMH